MSRSLCIFSAWVLAAVLALGIASPAAFSSESRVIRIAAVAPGAVDAKVLRVLVVPKAHSGRAIMVEFRAAERVAIDLRVIRYQATIAHSKVYKVRPGRWLVALPLAANVDAGRARIAVRLVDQAKHVAVYSQPIRIPPRN